MARVLKREAAKRDLAAQWVLVCRERRIRVADRFLQAADETLRLLSIQPECGNLFLTREPALRDTLEHSRRRVCQKCGCQPTWNDLQADHINPFPSGGRTDLVNAAILCAEHNRKKGKKVRSAAA
jgi:plasmid stabilization system protein ParE